MRNMRWHMLAICAGAAMWAILSGSFSLAEPPAEPVKVGLEKVTVAVCDVVEVFNNYKSAVDLNGKLEQRQRQIEEESKARLKAIEAKRMELESYKRGSDQYERTLTEMQRMAIDRKGWLELEKAKALRWHGLQSQKMYEEILQTIGRVARRRGAQVVLYRESRTVRSEATVDLIREIERRKVLYWDSRLDITADVLTAINQEYESRSQ